MILCKRTWGRGWVREDRPPGFDSGTKFLKKKMFCIKFSHSLYTGGVLLNRHFLNRT
jgi:hypothetical protein